MCGLVAVFSNDQPVDPEALRRATHALRHRGPDGERTWIGGGGRVGLGHARLSIIDLESVSPRRPGVESKPAGHFFGHAPMQERNDLHDGSAPHALLTAP
jgi:asparagine synthetase B (glutamine-hydrolysing)